MNSFCTLFDSNYSSRGLALLESLNRVATDFKVFVLAMDQNIFDVLLVLNLKNVEVISLKDFEDQDLLKIKQSRSRGEYCWTCTPSLIKYCLEKFNLEQCTYLDADLYFFSDPRVLLEEMQNKSILITDHRYTSKYNQAKTSGKYCVQFMSFKNTEEGLIVLNWWRDRCIEWCYARVEDGKFGDQKYLDDWMTSFSGVHELRHLGGGVAPWNVQQYTFQEKNESIELSEKMTKLKYSLVFFHFHALKIYKNKVDFGNYELPYEAVRLIYGKYVNALEKVDYKLVEMRLKFNWHAIEIEDCSLRSKLRLVKRKLLGTCNIILIKRELHG